MADAVPGNADDSIAGGIDGLQATALEHRQRLLLQPEAQPAVSRQPSAMPSRVQRHHARDLADHPGSATIQTIALRPIELGEAPLRRARDLENKNGNPLTNYGGWHPIGARAFV